MQKRILNFILICAVCFVSVAADGHGEHAEMTKEEAAVESALTWLGLVDTSEYGQSWEEAASFFRAVVAKEQWEQLIAGTRSPMGDVISRELDNTQYATELPGAPDGEYVVVQFKTSFTNKASAIETVTPMMDEDGHWRVSGYFIK